MLIKWISQFSNTGWRTDNCFAGFHLACSRLSVVGGERGKKGGTLSVVGAERKRRAREEKMGGDCLGSWGRAKKAGERGKKGETVSVVRGERRKKGGTLSVVGGERKKRASEEKMGEDCLGS